MPEFTNEFLGAKFALPERPNVRQILTYDSVRIQQSEQPPMVILWECAKTVVTALECEAFPQLLTADIDKLDDPKAARIIEWIGVTVSGWRRGLDEVPKN